MTGSGSHNFKTISDWHQDLLRNHIDLTATDDILEIGCGIGRDAIPLSLSVTTGSYVGTDIIKPSIDWLTDNVARRNPRFRFVHFDVEDTLHNPAGSTANTDVVLPTADGSIDKIFLFSVFTHMLADNIAHYLREFRRVLRPDGLVYATTFIFDDDILEAARRTNLTPFDLRFEHMIDLECRINDLNAPLGAVAYTKPALDRMISDAGLKHHAPTLKGSWSGFYPEPEEGQDVLILRVAE